MPDPKINTKPKFDPNKPFEEVATESKPKFDPSQPFEAVQKKSEDESKSTGSKDLSQPANAQKPLSGNLGTSKKVPEWGIDFDKEPKADNGFMAGESTQQTPIETVGNIKDEELKATHLEKQKVRNKQIEEGPGRIMNSIASIDQAFYNLPADALEVIAMGSNQVQRLTEMVGLEDRAETEQQPAYRWAKQYKNWIAELAPTNPAYADEIDTQVAGAIGNLASLVLSGGTRAVPKLLVEVNQLNKSANLLATGMREVGKIIKTPPSIIGALQTGVSEFESAKLSGASDDEAFGTFLKNAAAGGILESLPVTHFFQRLNTVTKGGVVQAIKNGTTQGIEEMTTEVAQQVFANVDAANTYDVTREWYDGMVESGGIGFGLGFVLGAMGAKLRTKQAEAKTPEEKADIQKAIDLVDEKGLELKTEQENNDKQVFEPGDTVELSVNKNEEINTQGEATENSPEQQVPVSEETTPEVTQSVGDLVSKRSEIIAGLPIDETTGQPIINEEAQAQLADLNNQINSIPSKEADAVVKEAPTGIDAGLSEETKTAIDKEINFLDQEVQENITNTLAEETPQNAVTPQDVAQEQELQKEPAISERDSLKKEADIKAGLKNNLIDKINEYNSNTKSKGAKDLRQSIIDGSQKQGFVIGSNNGRLTLQDDQGNKVNKTPIKQDKSSFVAFNERALEVKDFYTKFEQEGNLDIAGTVDVGKFDIGLSEKEFQKAKDDVKNGVKSVPAETLLNFVENIHKTGYIPFSIGEGSFNQKINIPVEEFYKSKVSDSEVDASLKDESPNSLTNVLASYSNDKGQIDWAKLKSDINNDPEMFSGFVHDLSTDELQTLKSIVDGQGQSQNQSSTTVDQDSQIGQQAQREEPKQGRNLQSIKDQARDARDNQDPEKARRVIAEIDGLLQRENLVTGDDASFADPTSQTFFDFLDQNKSVYLLAEDANIAQSQNQLKEIIDATPGAKGIDIGDGLSFDDAFDSGIIAQAKKMGFDGIRLLEIDGTNSTLQIWNFDKLDLIDGPELTNSNIPPVDPPNIDPEKGNNDKEDKLSGVKKALVSDEIIKGVDLEKISDKDMQTLAGKIIATNEVVPEAIVNEILEKPRALQPKEVVALIHYKAFLDNKLRDAYKKKNELFESGESTGSIDAEIIENERLVENFDIVAVITASQQSLAFRLRKGMLDKEYNLVTQINKYKSTNKGKIPPDVEAKFREWDKDLKNIKDQLFEAEKRAKQAEEELAIKNIKESIAREKAKTNIKAASKEIANKIRKAKFHKPGIFSSATPVSLLVDAALEISATTFEATGSIAQAIADGWSHIKKSDWYKNLTKDKQTEAEKAFAGMVSPSEASEERLSIPNSLIRQAVEEGNETIEDVTKYVKNVIKEDYPDITDREVRDAITKYGKTSNMSKDEIDTQIRKIKRMGKIISSLEDVASKKRPLRSGLQRDKLDAEERALGKQLKELMKDLPLDAETEARQLKTSLDAVKSRLNNQIEDLNREIETGEKTTKSKGVPYDQETKTLIEERDRVKALHDEVFGKNELTDEQRIERAIKSTERTIAETERRIAEKDLEIKKAKPVDSAELKAARERLSKTKAELGKLQEEAGIPAKKRLEQVKKGTQRRIEQLQEKLKNNDFSKRTPKPLIADTELVRLQAEKLRIQEEFNKAQYKNELKNRTRLQKAGDLGLEIFSSLWRALAASIDLSAVLVQGGLVSFRHPGEAVKSLGEMFKQLWSEKYQTQVVNNIKAQEWYPAMKASKLAITEIDGKYNAREEMFVSNWINVIWDVPANVVEKALEFFTKGAIKENKFSETWKKINLYNAANRAYTGYLNSMRIFRYLDGVRHIESQGKTFESNPEEYKAWADYVNNATGRGGLGPLETSAKPLALFFFSPRKLMSGLNLFTPYTFIYFGKMPKTVRQKAILDYASSLTILTITAILAEAAIKGLEDDKTDWEQFWNPNSSDFLKPKTKNTRIDLFRGFQQQVVVMSRLITGEFTDSKGETTKLGSRYGKDVNTRLDVVTKFFSNKFTPSLSFWKKVLDQKRGLETDWEEESIQQVMPIWIRDVDELYKDHPTVIAIMLNILTIFGGGVQTYGSQKPMKDMTPEERKERIEKMKEENMEKVRQLKIDAQERRNANKK